MASLADWNKKQLEVSLYEERNPPENDEGGGLRVHNPKDDPAQRHWVSLASEKSNYKRTLEAVVYAHGKWDKGIGDACLVVLRVHLGCTTRDARFKWVSLKFGVQKRDETHQAPYVISWAPFNEEQRSDQTIAYLKRIISLGGTLGVQQFVEAGIEGGLEWEKAFEKQYFRRAQSNPIMDQNIHDKEITGVHWYLEENGGQKNGVLPDFHLLLLLKPAIYEGKPQPFDLVIKELRLYAGWWYDKAGKYFQPKEEADEPLLIDPVDPTKQFEVCGNGERVEALVRKHINNLKTFRGDGMLQLVDKINRPQQPANDQDPDEGP